MQTPGVRSPQRSILGREPRTWSSTQLAAGVATILVGALVLRTSYHAIHSPPDRDLVNQLTQRLDTLSGQLAAMHDRGMAPEALGSRLPGEHAGQAIARRGGEIRSQTTFSTSSHLATTPKNLQGATTLNDLHTQDDRSALQAIYATYHANRGESCTGCAYVKSLLRSIKFSSVIDVGAANCKVTRAFIEAGKQCRAVEFSEYIIQQFCSDLVNDGVAFNAAAHELDMFDPEQFDLVFCADVLEHVPQSNIDETLQQFSRVGSRYYFFVIHDAPAQKDKKSLTKDSQYKIHETVQPRSWWIAKLARYGMHEDSAFRNAFIRAAEHHLPQNLRNSKQYSRMYFLSKH